MLHTYYSQTEPLSVSATDVSDTVLGAGSSGRVPAAGDENTVCTPVGGKTPYSFLWEKQTDAEGDAFTISDSSEQSPGWYGTNRDDGYSDNTETWRVTVTDDNSDTAQDTINVTLTWIDNS